MKLRIKIVLVLITLRSIAISQPGKPVLGTESFGQFTSVTSVALSGDGRFAIYSINDPAGKSGGTFLKALGSSQPARKVGMGQFTTDSHFYAYHLKDSLLLLDLAKEKIVLSLKSVADKIIGNHLASQTQDKVLSLIEMNSGRNVNFKNVDDFYLTGRGLLLVTKDDSGHPVLKWWNNKDRRERTLWEGSSYDNKLQGLIVSSDGNGLAFITEQSGKISVWYSTFQGPANKLIDQADPRISSTLSLVGINNRGFTTDGKKLFIDLKEKVFRPASDDAVKVDLWSYNDKILQSEQLKHLKPRTFVAIFNIADSKLISVENRQEKLLGFSNEFALTAVTNGDETYDEYYWNTKVRASVNLINLKDGKKRVVNDSIPSSLATTHWLSPCGKYVLYYNAKQENFFSYNVNTGVRSNITNRSSGNWTRYDKRDIKAGPNMPIFSANNGKFAGDEALLLYDQCDIYQVDPSGKNSAICLTAGFGRRENVEFRLALESSENVFHNGEKVIISGFNRKTKDDGFYEITIGKNVKPNELYTGAYLFKGTWEDERFTPTYPVKADRASVFLVRRSKASEEPNYFWTKDFKEYKPLTDVHPERQVNWMTSELINFPLPDGRTEQGILYKPENFDPHKRYPVIFHYYERMTEALHAFMPPEESHGELPISYFVSNGYLVFTPDIHYTIGHPGQSVLNTMVSAAIFLGNLPYVDKGHFGLEGHSRGGWETNFVITHSNLFAAATSAAGFSNYTSLYNGVRLLRSGTSRQPAFEILYQRIGATLWEKPELYIENSPIFKVDQVQTPVLMFANPEDDDVPVEQGLQFFTALRRLGKKAWMLQYEGERHIIFGKAAFDFTLRMKQFFDHYLKDAPAPKWMLDGIPAERKGLDDGLQLDTTGRTPGVGLLKTEK